MLEGNEAIFVPLGWHGVTRRPTQLPCKNTCDGPHTGIIPTAPIRVEKDGVGNPLNV